MCPDKKRSYADWPDAGRSTACKRKFRPKCQDQSYAWLAPFHLLSSRFAAASISSGVQARYQYVPVAPVRAEFTRALSMAFLTKTETGPDATNGVYEAYPRTKTFR